MTSLIERASELTRRADTLRKVRDDDFFARSADNYSVQIERALSAGTEALEFLEKAQALSVEIDLGANVHEAMVLRKEAARALQRFLSEPQELVRSPEIGDFLSRLQNLCEQMQGTARGVWRSLNERATPWSASMPVLRANERRPDVGVALNRLGAIDMHLAVLRKMEQPTPNDVDGLQRLWEEGNDLWNGVQGQLVSDPEILEFLESASSEGAPLSSLSDKVREFLESIGALDEYVIRSRE